MLRGINSDSVDLIYLDPPFNKGKAFVAPIGTTADGASFDDIWTPDEVKDEIHNQLNDPHPDLYDLIEAISKAGGVSTKYYLIYMAVRLIELRRVLKEEGTLFLHCDQTAGHYLKILLDSIFGYDNFRNEIIWYYKGAAMTAAKKILPRKHDVIFFYSKNCTYEFYPPREKQLSESMKKRWGSLMDKFGNIRWGQIKNEPGQVKKYLIRLTKKLGREPKDRDIVWVAKPSLVRSVWHDIPEIRNNKKYLESVGYPTQKPLVLLERIIQMASKKGDLILDPFCGCATTCVASEKFERNWIGIDISQKAYELVQDRLKKEVPPNLLRGNVLFRTDIPTRTDLPHKTKPTKEDKEILFVRQNYKCMGCLGKFDIINLEIDHIVPQSQGGSHELDNLQLLCGNCNRVKGNRPMTYLRSRIQSRQKYLSG